MPGPSGEAFDRTDRARPSDPLGDGSEAGLTWHGTVVAAFDMVSQGF